MRNIMTLHWDSKNSPEQKLSKPEKCGVQRPEYSQGSKRGECTVYAATYALCMLLHMPVVNNVHTRN